MIKKSLSRIQLNFRAVESLIVFAQQKKLNLNCRWIVIFVLILAKLLSESESSSSSSSSVEA